MDLETIVKNEARRLQHTFGAQKAEVKNPERMPVLSGALVYYYNDKPEFMDVPSVSPRDSIGELFLDSMIRVFARHNDVPQLAMYSWEGWLQDKIHGVNSVDPSHRQIITVGASDTGESGLFVTPIIRGEINRGFYDSGRIEDETLLSKMKEVKDVAEDEGYSTIRE
jgi:hypothetical protein